MTAASQPAQPTPGSVAHVHMRDMLAATPILRSTVARICAELAGSRDRQSGRLASAGAREALALSCPAACSPG